MGEWTIRQDIRQAIRTIRRQPAFASAAIAMLALGIGATIAIFTVVKSILIDPLPYPDSDRLVRIVHNIGGIEQSYFNDAIIITYTAQAQAFESVGAWSPSGEGVTITGDGEPEEVRALTASRGFLTTLGVQPEIGRWFTSEEGPESDQGLFVPRSPRRVLDTRRDPIGRLWPNWVVEAPIPESIRDHASAVVLNVAGIQSRAPGYLTGKPFTHFVDLRKRAAMQSWLAAVLRGDGPAHLESRLAQRGWAEDVHLTLTRLELPTEAQPLVLVAMSPPMSGAEEEGPAPLESAVEDQVVVLAARRLDVLTRMTRLLLRGTAPTKDLALTEAADLLADSYADWVIIDVCDLPGDPGAARRAAVVGPADAPECQREEVAARVPGDSDIPGEVLGRGQSLLFPLIEDETVLGHADRGAPLLSVLGAGSLLSVPLRGTRGVRGALTLIRRSNRGSFRLADLGLIEEIGEHIGLALPPPPQ